MIRGKCSGRQKSTGLNLRHVSVPRITHVERANWSVTLSAVCWDPYQVLSRVLDWNTFPPILARLIRTSAALAGFAISTNVIRT